MRIAVLYHECGCLFVESLFWSRGNGFVYFAGLGISQAGWDVFSMDVVSRLRDFSWQSFAACRGRHFFVEAGFD